jgi:hypothetical protein
LCFFEEANELSTKLFLDWLDLIAYGTFNDVVEMAGEFTAEVAFIF